MSFLFLLLLDSAPADTALDASVVVSATATSTLTTSIPLAATASVAATTSAALTTQIRLAATVLATATVSARFPKVGNYLTTNGVLTQPTVTGNQTIRGIGFQPKIVLFWTDGLTENAAAAGALWSFGAGVSATERRAVGIFNVNGVAVTAIPRGHDDTKCILIFADSSGTVTAAADFVSQDADGFTINWSAVDTLPRFINYVALGGVGLTNVKIGTITSPLTASNQATTGIGFRPSTLIFFESRSTTVAPPSSGLGSACMHFGVTTGTGAQWAQGFHSLNSLGTSDEVHTQQSGVCIAYPNILAGAGAAMQGAASLVSFDADGFTLNWSQVSGQAFFEFYIALAGLPLSAGVFTNTGTTPESVTGIGFKPQLLFLSSFNDVLQTSGQIASGVHYSWGLGDQDNGVTSRRAQFYGAAHGANPTVTTSEWDPTAILKLEIEGNPSPTVQSVADLSSFDVSGFTVTWPTNTVTSQSIAYLAVSEPTVGIPLAASVTVAATTTGALTTAIVMAATATAVATQTSALTTAIPLASSVTVAVTTAPAGLTTAIRMAASVTAASTVAAALTTQIPLATTATVVATTTAALTTAIRFASSVTAAATTTAGLTTAITMAATATGVVTTAAAFTTAIRMAASAAVAATTVGALTTQVALAAAVSATAQQTSGLTTQIALAAAAMCAVTTSAALTTAIRMAGSVTGVVTVVATISGTATPINAAVTVSATASGALSTAIALASTVTASATTTATLSTAIRLTAAPTATATVVADLTTQIRFASSVGAAASVSGALSTAIAMAAVAPATVTSSAALTTAIQLSATSTATVLVTAQLADYLIQIAADAIGRVTTYAALTSVPQGPASGRFFDTPAMGTSRPIERVGGRVSRRQYPATGKGRIV